MAELSRVDSRSGAGRLIERFIPHAHHGGHHETLVRAPADVVFDVA